MTAAIGLCLVPLAAHRSLLMLLAGLVVLEGFPFGVPAWLALKHEKVKLAECQNFEGIAGCIPAFIEQLYKRERLRAALGCVRTR